MRIEHSISVVVREEWGRCLALLIRALGDIQAAEDALQDAVESALRVWKRDGLPDSPAAWLLQAARNKAIDQIRRRARFARLQPELTYLQSLASGELIDTQAIPDKRLELIFICCHPALEQKTRIALTLRTLGGLTTEEIARAFIDKPATMAQRLSRAKHKIAAANISYEVPEQGQLAERIRSVLSVVYLIFNEGYAVTSGPDLYRADLSNEAIRLGRILIQLLPENPEVAGLLSLMLLHDSRRRARKSLQGALLTLEMQDRSAWDKLRIEEATALLKVTLQRQQVGPYQLQAAISALHSEAQCWEETDWKQISALYQLLYQLQPTVVVRINQSVAVSYAESCSSALKLLDEVESSGEVSNYQPFYAAKADILFRKGLHSAASENYAVAIELATNDAERTYLLGRQNACK